MKDRYKKNRVRLVKVNMGNGILITNEEIDQLKLELEEKKAKAAEKQLRAKKKKSQQGKKKIAIPRPRRQKKVSFASVESVEFYVLTDTGQILLLNELLLTNNFLDKEDQVVVPSTSTSRSGRTIRPSRGIREGLNRVSIKSQGLIVFPLLMVPHSRGGRN